MLNQQKILTALNAMQNDNIPLTQKNVIKYGNKYNLSNAQLVKEFGNFNNAKLALGLPIHSNKYTKEEVVSKLKAIFTKYGTISKEILEVEKEIYVNLEFGTHFKICMMKCFQR